MSPKPKTTTFNKDKREWIALQAAKKAAAKQAGPATSWWIGTSRDEFQAEVQRRHTVRMVSGKTGERSLGKAV